MGKKSDYIYSTNSKLGDTMGNENWQKTNIKISNGLSASFYVELFMHGKNIFLVQNSNNNLYNQNSYRLKVQLVWNNESVAGSNPSFKYNNRDRVIKVKTLW